MKFLPISVFLFLTTCLSAQDIPPADTLPAEEETAMIEQLVVIQDLVRNIDRRFDYQINTLLNEEFMDETTDGGGQLTAYQSADGVHKVEVRLFGSNGQVRRTYYFADHRLIFVRENEIRFLYDIESDSFDYSEEETLFKGAYSFQNGELLFEESVGERVYSRTSDPESFHLDLAAEYLRILGDED